MKIHQVQVTYVGEITLLVMAEQRLLAMTAVFFYEWLSTLSLEIAEIWNARWSYVKCLYLCTRYFNWAFWILSTVQLFIFPDTLLNPKVSNVCNTLNIISSILVIVARLASMELLTLRVWAIYQLSRLILISLGFLSFGLFAINILAMYGVVTFVNIDRVVGFSFLLFENKGPLLGGYCILNRYKLTTTWYPSMIWGSLVFNAVVFFLTLLRTWGSHRTAKKAGIYNSFHAYILKDGSLYYLAIALLDIAYISMSLNGYLDDISLTTLASLNSVLETIISCRLVLRLRRLSRDSSPSGSISQISSADIHFSRNGFLGNIGAPLRSVEEEMDDFKKDIEVSREEHIESFEHDSGSSASET